MRRAAALVTDGGGMTCHAAIVVARARGARVVGTRTQPPSLHDGQLVTVDGQAGEVLRRAPAADPAVPRCAITRRAGTNTTRVSTEAIRPQRGSTSTWPSPSTPRRSRRCRSTASACFARSSWSLTPSTACTLALLLAARRAADIRRRDDGVAAADHPGVRTRDRSIYRSIDFRSNEFRGLEGGEEFEPHEENPMIGYRGCFRYVDQPDLFRLELDVLGAVAAQTPNLRLMIPFVRTAWELERCLDIVREHPTALRLPVWVMAEVPSVAYWIPTYAKMGIEGVSIGSNDLTQLMLGVDRDSEVLRRAVRRGRPSRARRDRRIVARLPGRRHHFVAVRPGAVQPPRVRRAPRPAGDHLDLGQPRRRQRRAPDDRERGMAPHARRRRVRPPRHRRVASAARDAHPADHDRRRTMIRTVVVYESMYGNTHAIAEAIALGLGDGSAVVPVTEASAQAIADADLLVIGGPTHTFGMSRPQTRAQAVHDAEQPAKHLTVEPGAAGAGIREWLASAELMDRSAAAFDTRVRMPCFGAHAAPKFGHAVTVHGGRLLRRPESFFVTKQNTLVDGEIDRARRWGTDLGAIVIGSRTKP